MNEIVRNVCRYGTTRYSSASFQFELIDFSIVIRDASPHLRSRLTHFRDALIQRFSREEKFSDRKIRWIILLIWPEIYPEVIEFLRILKSQTFSHTIAFVSFGDSSDSSVAELKRHYIYNVFFSLSLNESNYETIFEYFANNDNLHQSHRNNERSFPLRLHANSISSGLCFNYFYSYLNRQIGSTNNIVLLFTYDRQITVDRFPQYLIVEFVSQIEEFSPPTHSTTVRRIWDPIRLKFESSTCHERETIVKYFVNEIGDLGETVETLRIFSPDFPLDDLKTIELCDDVRRWKHLYDGPGQIDRDALIFHQRHEEFLHQCQFYSRQHDGRIGQTIGVCTMKKTNEDTFLRYIKDQPTIREIRIIPKYYLIALSSCNFGSVDLDGSFQDGIIREDNIQLARLSNGEVLQSPRMHHYARYLCRTYYYFDEKINENEVIRYLFCAEYPFILSTLYQMEQQGLISRRQKREEYLRFCNMLNRILTFHHLNDSIKLIEYDDENLSFAIADSPSIREMIRQDINGCYDRIDDPTSSIDFDAILRIDEAKRSVRIYSTDRTLTNFIDRTLSEKLRMNDYQLVDHDDQAEQTIFICTNDREENEKIIEQVVKKMNERHVLRDVFVFVDRAIEDFPAHFIRLVPFITIDRENVDENKIDEVIDYLQKMNILSRDYADEATLSFSSFEQVTSIGIGCAAALYFNYIRIVAPHPQHRQRIDSIERDFNQDRIHRTLENQAIFIRRWLFVLPWTIENSAQLINDAMRQENSTDFQLSIWKQSNLTVSLTVGGIVNRSYSPLKIYRLANVKDRRTFYFPMEIPQAMIALQTRYEEIQSQFNFGRFDPEKQAEVFQETFLEYQRREMNDQCRNEILLVPLIKRENLNNDEEQAKVLLKSLWETLIGL